MRLLVLGGTLFLGRHVVEAALARGHEVTLFNRGLTAPGLFPEAEHVAGDRDGGLDALRGRGFDGVVDTLRDDPRLVGAAAALLGPAVERYCFVSSISVYADLSRPGWDERSPLREEGDDYGARKARCERAVEAAVGDRALLLRPGLIVGPWDPTNRFAYWATRLARGGEILAPGPPELPVQVIDARDLAGWTVRALEEGRAGVFNAVGPAYPLTLRDVLAGYGPTPPGSRPRESHRGSSCRSGSAATPSRARTARGARQERSAPASPSARSPRRSPTRLPGRRARTPCRGAAG